MTRNTIIFFTLKHLRGCQDVKYQRETLNVMYNCNCNPIFINFNSLDLFILINLFSMKFSSWLSLLIKRQCQVNVADCCVPIANDYHYICLYLLRVVSERMSEKILQRFSLLASGTHFAFGIFLLKRKLNM